MHPRLTPLVDDLERQRAALLATVASHAADVLDRKPSPELWSPAEVIEHLAVVENGVARLLAKRLQRAQEAGLPQDTITEPVTAILEQAFLTQKIEAPENVRPLENVSSREALDHLRVSHQALQETLAAADGYDLTKVMAHHQIFGDLNMYEWLIFLARHEERHVVQIRRALPNR